MPDVSPILSLPYIQPSQAQKHVTHNEALRTLDLLVQMVVQTRGSNVPPPSPVEGERHIVGPAPTGLWAGKAQSIAVLETGVWQFVTPLPGWGAHVLAEDDVAQFIDGAWVGATERSLRVSALGVNTAPDGFNKLSVAAQASLLTHAGAGGHQLKLNKAQATDTASLLFQTGFSGRAEMGTTGSDDFAVKVSADGSSFADALRVAAATGVVAVPQGVRVGAGTAGAPGVGFDADPDNGMLLSGVNQIALATGGAARLTLDATGLSVSVPVTGTAVTQSATDGTAGRLMRTGDFGLGGAAVAPPSDDLSAVVHSGLYAAESTTLNKPATGGASGGTLYLRRNATEGVQLFASNAASPAAPALALRRRTAGAWSGWATVYHDLNLLGTVSQTAGVPTGAVIEAGSNANGLYRRFACGMQICWRDNLSAANASTALGSLFRSADVTWTYPVAFFTGTTPVVVGSANDSDAWVTTATPAAASVVMRVVAGVTKGAAVTFRATATGRWF